MSEPRSSSSSRFRVQVFGPLLLLKDGEPVKLRTRHQGLLLARLVAYGEKGVQRAETADLLWPEVEWSNAGAYLRRAIKELRELGIEIRSVEDRLFLDPEQVDSDLQALIRAEGARKFAMDDGVILEGWEHPIRDEVRSIMRRFLVGIVRAPSDAAAKPAINRTEGGGLAWIGEALVQTRPEVALELLAKEWNTFSHNNSLEVVLSLGLRVLAANPEISRDRLRLLTHTGLVAVLLTRFGMAEKLFTETLEGAEKIDDPISAAHALSGYAMLTMELRDWPRALDFGERALTAATVVNDVTKMSTSRNNLAGVQWHTLDFTRAAENYRIAWEAAPDLGENERKIAALIARANSTYLWAVFGTEVQPEPEPFREVEYPQGYAAIAESYLQFSSGFGFRDPTTATAGALRMLEVASEGMERLVCVALDCAAFCFAMRGHSEEAAAAVRVGSRLRFRISHPRSPAEKLAVRRHVTTPLFGKRVPKLVTEWDSDELSVMQRLIGARLRVPRAL